MTNAGKPRRLVRTHRGFEVMESGVTIAKGLNFADAFNLLRETGDYLPMFFDRMHFRHGDILENIIDQSFGIKGFNTLSEVPFPFTK